MKTIITYVTDDGKEFNDVFQARRHECELTDHKWDYFDTIGNKQKQNNENTKVKFCRFCSKQEVLN